MKYLKNIFSFSFASLLIFSPGVGHSQIGGLGGLLNPSSILGSGGGSDLSGSQDSLVRNYVAAGKYVMTANGHFASALGIQAQAVNANATSDSLSAKDIEAQDKAISADAAAISEAIKAGATLKDAEAKAKYAQGLFSLVSGLKKYKDMSAGAQSFASGLSSASPMVLPKLDSGVYIVKNLPSNLSNLSNTLSTAIDFAKKNGVEVPADATSVL